LIIILINRPAMIFSILLLLGSGSFRPIHALHTGPGPIGLMVVAHGANAEWNDQVRELVAQVRWNQGPVEVAFLMGDEVEEHGWKSGVNRLLAKEVTFIVVVPLMVSSRGGHYRQVLYYAGQRFELPHELLSHGHEPPFHPVPMVVTAALDDAPELAEAITLAWSKRVTPSASLVLLGHGPNHEEDVDAWLTDLSKVAERLKAEGHLGEIQPALLRDDAPPDLREATIRSLRKTILAMADRTQDSVTVMTILVARGSMTRTKIPADLLGLPVRYIPSVLTPLPPIARWIERVALAGSTPPQRH